MFGPFSLRIVLLAIVAAGAVVVIVFHVIAVNTDPAEPVVVIVDVDTDPAEPVVFEIVRAVVYKLTDSKLDKRYVD